MARIWTGAVRGALMLAVLAASWVSASAQNPAPPPQKPTITNVTISLEGGNLAIEGGTSAAPPGSIIKVVGLPDHPDLVIPIGGDGNFGTVVPVTPGDSGTLQLQLTLPDGTIADTHTTIWG